MKTLLRAGLTAVLALAASAAMAQSKGRIYMEVKGGAVVLDDADNTGGGVTVDTSFDPGFTYGGALGYADPRGLRGELELSYRENEVDEASASNLVPQSASGDMSAFTALANAYYDFETYSPWTPFVGAGVGFAIVGVDGRATTFGSLDDEDTVFAYQAGAGLAYELSPHWTFSLGYRYLGTADPEFSSPQTGTFQSEYSSHNLLGGIRFTY